MTADVIVIGGGVIGSAATYNLTKRGLRVIQLERDYFSSGASGACDQMVIPQSKNPNEHLSLALYSVELYKHLSEELGRDVEYVRKGALILIENEQERETMAGIVEKQNALGLPTRMISTQEAMRMQPGLNPDAIVGAVYGDVDGEVNPFKMNLAFTDRAKEMGAVVRTGEAVQEILIRSGKVCGVKTGKGTYYAPVVVNAAGAWAPVVGAMAGLNIPIKPRRGQVFITETMPPFVHKCVLNARYIVAKHHPETLKNDHSLKAKLGVGIALTQSRKGNILFGGTREFVGYDTQNSVDGIMEAAKNAIHLVPGLKHMKLIRLMGGVRPYPPDSKPLIGYVNQLEGFFMAAGHEGDGICLAPASGKLVADLIVDGVTDVPAAASFDPNRFNLSK